jgi:pyruvate dehydrogenase (quinone)
LPRAVPVCRPDDLGRAAKVLNRGTKIAIVAGQGALRATDALEEVAERLAAPIVKALHGKAAVPDDSPYTTGTIGLLGTRPSQEVLEECDTLLMAGMSFPYLEFLPRPGQARAVQIELNPRASGSATPSRWASWATAAGRYRRCCRSSAARVIAAFSNAPRPG